MNEIGQSRHLMNLRAPLILASGSPRRSDLLRGLGVPFQVQASAATEIQPGHLTPQEICQVNAHRKAGCVATLHPEAWVLGADTLVFLEQQVYGKPKDLRQASEMLSELQGRAHHVITGVCLMNLKHGNRHLFAETTAVRFRELTAGDISSYLSLIQPLDKAGAYAIQEHGERIVESIHGSWSNVVGLPIERLGTLLKELGIAR